MAQRINIIQFDYKSLYGDKPIKALAINLLSLYNNAIGTPCRLADNSRAGYDTVRDGLLSKLARDAMREGVVDEDYRQWALPGIRAQLVNTRTQQLEIHFVMLQIK